MRAPHQLLIALIVFASSSCEEGTIQRQVTLAYHDGVPAAQAAVTGDSVRIDVQGMESTTTSYVLMAWAHRTDDTWVQLGAVMPGMTMDFMGTPLGISWADISELMITDEAAHTELTAPSDMVQFSGQPGFALQLGGSEGPDLEALQETTATAEITNDDVAIHYDGLPPLGGGRFYGVWLLPGGTSEAAAMEGMDMGPSTAPTHTDGPKDPAWVGQLDMSGHQEFHTGQNAAIFHEVAITMELEHGVMTPALMSIVLRGPIPGAATAAAGGAAPKATHEH